MKFAKIAAIAALALTGALTTISGAFAYEAAATTAVNVRTGPGTNYGVVGALSANQIVDVVECNASNTWCRIEAANIRGWSSANYLRPLTAERPTPRPTPAPTPSTPNVGVSVNTPNFSFSIGGGNGPRPGVRPVTGEICFYEGYDYRGRSFCVDNGEQDRVLANFWNDRIRSARVDGNIEATVCTGSNYSGRCAVIDRSVRNMGMLADNISSYYVDAR